MSRGENAGVNGSAGRRDIFEEETKRKPLAFCGGRWLWEMNAAFELPQAEVTGEENGRLG
jgi:hypothetical protein